MLRYSNELKLTSKQTGLTHIHRSNAEARLMGVVIKTNELGARSKSMVDLANKKLIAFYGGSITLGWGVEQEHCFSNTVTKQLGNISKEPLESLNFGIGNYNLESSLRLLLLTIESYQPLSIFISVYSDDFTLKNHGRDSLFFHHSYLGNFLFYRFQQISSLLGLNANGNNQETKLNPALRELIIQTKSQAEEKNINLKFILIPNLLESQNNESDRNHWQQLLNLLAENKISTIDIRGIFDSIPDRKATLWVAPDDPHPNSHGHRLIAQAILKQLTSSQREPVR